MKGQLSQRASSAVCFYSNPIYSDETVSKFGNKTIASFNSFSVKRGQHLASFLNLQCILLSRFLSIYLFLRVSTYDFLFL